MIRATHRVHSGTYYYEALILNQKKGEEEQEQVSLGNKTKDSNPPSPHFRVGWAARQAELEGPVGYDKFSFGYRDVGGTIILLIHNCHILLISLYLYHYHYHYKYSGAKVHASLREDDYGESYSAGDVVGCFIRLDETNSQNNEIRFFKNGKPQGTAYQGSMIDTGIYFPAVSIYMAVSWLLLSLIVCFVFSVMIMLCCYCRVPSVLTLDQHSSTNLITSAHSTVSLKFNL